MARKPVLSGGKRDELVEKALQLFIEHGYENTSVRQILSAVNGEIGMFYHYFRSKYEIFEAAVDLYLSNFVAQFSALPRKENLKDQFDSILDLFTQSMQEFVHMGAQNLHWTVAVALHQRTLHSMLPIVESMIKQAIECGRAYNPLAMESGDIAAFLLFGTSGILHQKPFSHYTQEEILQKRDAARALACYFLGLEG